MWSKSHTTTVKGLKASQVWKIWANVDEWHTWQGDVDCAKLHGEFKPGTKFTLKPKGGPRVQIEILSTVENGGFVDLTRFPLALMYGSHEFYERNGTLHLTTTISVEGPLSFLW